MDNYLVKLVRYLTDVKLNLTDNDGETEDTWLAPSLRLGKLIGLHEIYHEYKIPFNLKNYEFELLLRKIYREESEKDKFLMYRYLLDIICRNNNIIIKFNKKIIYNYYSILYGLSSCFSIEDIKYFCKLNELDVPNGLYNQEEVIGVERYDKCIKNIQDKYNTKITFEFVPSLKTFEKIENHICQF